MTYTHPTTRLATTAIAAVLALSATPLNAQEVPPPDTTTVPPAATTPDPLAPEPAATEPVAEPAPATTATKTTGSKSASKAKTATRAATKAPTRPAEPAPAAAAPAAPAEPVEAAPIVDARPITEPASPAPVEPVATSQLDMDEALPIAGAGALALLGLTGAAVALRRRKRRREDSFAKEQYQSEQTRAEPIPAAPNPAVAAPAVAMVPRHDPVAADAPKTTLPEGFDLSRFGRNVQAAYRGPTPDNPSLSLKYRLRRAAALDQRERIAGTAEPEARPAKAPAQRPMVHSGGSFILGEAGPKAVDRPAFSKAN